MTPTREECIAAAGRALAWAHERREALDPHAAAVAAQRPGGPTVAELENLIRAQRELPPLDPTGPTDTSRPSG